MFWKEVQPLSPAKFKRLTGVTLTVFILLRNSLETATVLARKHPRRGVSSKLCVEDRLLLLLMYYREYRTMYHIGFIYNISESTVCKMIMDTEKKLMSDPRFHLLGKKTLWQPANKFEVVLIDVAETPIERPKKSNVNTTRVRKNDIP